MGLVVDFGFKADNLDIEDANLFSRFIITNADKNQLNKKKVCQTSELDIQK